MVSLCLASLLALNPPWELQAPGFEIELVATGFQLPVSIAFVPDADGAPDAPFFYVAELYGNIKAVTRSGMVSDYATGLLNFEPTGDFPGSGEQGLAGIVVDPVSRDVFATLLYDSAISPGTHYPKVIRLGSIDGGRTAATETTILDMAGEAQGPSHQISNVSIGPDDKLYVHMGDGFNPATAQNLASYRGKILRMNLDGSAPADNPFYNAGDGIGARDYVFAYGFRNPFGGAWRGADALHYEVENGPSVDRMAQVLAGQNYMWNGTNASMFQMALHNWDPSVAPINIAFVEAETSCGSGWPVSMLGRAYVTESGPTWATGPQEDGKRITEFVLDAGGSVVSGPSLFLDYVGSGKATAAALAAGPDGLYFSDLYQDLNYTSPIDPGANVFRIRSLVAPPPALRVSPTAVDWTLYPDASGYDLVRGDLGLLLGSGGDFTQATDVCVADDQVSPPVPDTDPLLPDQAFWYLLRVVHGSRVDCYESPSTGQRGARDAEIDAAPMSCP